MIMRINWKKLVISVAIPLLVGGLSALISRSDMGIYESIKQPPLNPGSVSIPKQDSEHSYIILDDTGIAYKNLDMVQYRFVAADEL